MNDSTSFLKYSEHEEVLTETYEENNQIPISLFYYPVDCTGYKLVYINDECDRSLLRTVPTCWAMYCGLGLLNLY